MENTNIPENRLKEFFEKANGRCSNYLFLEGEPKDFLKLCVEEGWLQPLPNTEKKPWYRVTIKLLEKFIELNSITKAQLAAQAVDAALLEVEKQAEEVRATKSLENKITTI